VGSIYTWFKDKRDLFSAALQYSIANQQKTNAELLQKLRSTKSLGTDTTPWTLAVAALNPFDPDSAQPSESQKLLLEAMKMAWRDDEMKGIIQPLLVSFFEQYVDVIETAQKTGDIHENVDTEILARVMMAMPIGLAFLNLAALEAPLQARYVPIFAAISKAARLNPES
jgi:AcrR family transcriptional regulator